MQQLKQAGCYAAAFLIVAFIAAIAFLGFQDGQANLADQRYRQENHIPQSHGCNPDIEDCSDANPYLVP